MAMDPFSDRRSPADAGAALVVVAILAAYADVTGLLGLFVAIAGVWLGLVAVYYVARLVEAVESHRPVSDAASPPDESA